MRADVSQRRIIRKSDLTRYHLRLAQYDAYRLRVRAIKPPVSFEVFCEVADAVTSTPHEKNGA